MMRKPNLCIVSPWNYPLFNLDNQTHFGGWEVRITLIAKELAKCGRLKVSLVVADHGQPHREQREGVTIYSWIGRPFWGIPMSNDHASDSRRKHNFLVRVSHWLNRRFLSLNWPYAQPPLLSGQIGPCVIEAQFISIYDEVDADIYMVPGNSLLSAEMAFYCQQRDKKYVFLAGSDIDFNPAYKTEPEKLDLYGVPYCLKAYAIENAHMHITQNEYQADLLRQGYGRAASVIRNPIDLTLAFPRKPEAGTILWVGKSDERVKRPSLILELARRLPAYTFVVIMTQAIPETHQQCVEEAQKLPNVTMVNRVPFHEIEQYFAQAQLHVNTSAFEGFPNTFLQAAKYGVPTLAAKVDPGEMLSQHGCGVSCHDDLELLVKNVCLFMTNPGRYAAASACCLDYIRTYHDKDKIIPQYENALASLL